MRDTPETDKAEDSDPLVEGEWQWIVPSSFARRLERERDAARRERDIMEDSLKWIAGRYCHEKTTVHLALVAYEMSSEARWTLQEMEQKEEA